MTGTTFVARRGTQAIPNATVYDDRLSYGALGLLLVSLARPDQASKGYRALMGRGLGEKATRAALRELEDAGYRHVFRRRETGGVFKAYVILSEAPITRDEAEHELRLNLHDRAADGAARSDQAQHPVSARRTVPRSTAARSTAARSRTASLRDKDSLGLRPENPEKPSARNTEKCDTHGLHLPCAGCRADALAKRDDDDENTLEVAPWDERTTP